MPQSRNVLKRVRTKRASKLDFKSPLDKYIRRVYGDHVAQEAEEALDELQELRNQIVAASSSTSALGSEHYAKYLHALRAVEIRFPVSSDNSHVHVAFKWHDAFVDRDSCTQKNIHFEKAAVLFCLGALEGQRGADESRDSQGSIAEAAKSFSQAAGVFKFLREEVVLKTDTPRSVDLSAECCTLLETVMLAQAQEMCFELLCLKKASSSAIKWATLAQVAACAAELYTAAAEAYLKPQLVRHVQREWGESNKCKALMYRAESNYLQAKHSTDNPDEQGLRNGYLEAAVKMLKAEESELRAAPADLQKQAKALQAEIAAEAKSAHQENLGIYMQRVPPPEHLPRIDSKQMAQPRSPEAELLARSEAWFADIVPDKVTRNLSRYTSQMEDLVRGFMGKLEQATDDTRTALTTHGLPAVLDAMNPGYRPELPEVAKAALCDDFVQRGLAGQLPSMTDTVAALRDQAELDLRKCGEMLDEEQARDEALRAQHRDAWQRPPSRVAAAGYRENIARYESNLAAAVASDGANAARLTEAQPRLNALSTEGVRGRLPPLERPMVAPEIDPDAVTGNLRQIIAQLGALSSERAALEERIRAKRQEDNVLPDLLQAGADGADRVFEQHLEALRGAASGVDANVGRTNEALSVLEQYAATFRRLYDVDGWQERCQKVGEEVRDDVRTGNDLIAQLGEGVTFYSGLQEHVNKLKQMCADYVLARNMDADRRVNDAGRAREARESEDAARRMHQMDLNLAGRSNSYTHPQHQQHPPSPPPPPGPHMYPQHAGPAPSHNSPYSMYPAPPPPDQGNNSAPPPPPPHQWGTQLYPPQPPPHDQGQPAPPPPQQQQYYSSQMYPRYQ